MEQPEMIDVVDMEDNVIGAAPRKGIHGTNLMHRSVHIFLLDSTGNVWLERRAQSVDTFPGHYSSSAAGHVQKGESYLEGAKREALEELGLLNLNLEHKHKLSASSETSNEFVGFFVARSDEKPRPHSDTERLEAFSIKDIDGMISRGEKFVPIFLKLFDWYKLNAAPA